MKGLKMQKIVTIQRKCYVCGNLAEVEMPIEAFKKYADGMLIQNAWPEATPEESEIIITGMHSHCFNEFVREPDEPDYDEYYGCYEDDYYPETDDSYDEER